VSLRAPILAGCSSRREETVIKSSQFWSNSLLMSGTLVAHVMDRSKPALVRS
jgi:hypothetical protein